MNDWGVWGSETENARYMEARDVVDRRHLLKCRCGCEGKATHVGMANGVGLMSGCELSVRRWVKSPNNARAARRRVKRGPAQGELL